MTKSLTKELGELMQKNSKFSLVHNIANRAKELLNNRGNQTNLSGNIILNAIKKEYENDNNDYENANDEKK